MNTPAKMVLSLVVALALSITAHAGPNVALDNILMSKVNGVTKIEIWPGCTMRYVDHTPADAGLELRIRVLTDLNCAAILSDVSTERYAPSSLRLGNVNEVLFDRLSDRETYITLLFDAPQKFEIRQHQVGWIEVFVDTTVVSTSLPAARPAPLAPGPTETAPAAASLPRSVVDRTSIDRPRADRGPTPGQGTRNVNVAPAASGDYVVQLGVFGNPGPAIAGLEQSATPHFAYATNFEVNGREWHGINVGFFNTEADAATVLASLSPQFPDAWVRFVNAEERSLAQAGADLRQMANDDVVAVRIVREAPASPAVLQQAMADARSALLEQRYRDAIREYTLVLESPGHDFGPEAREMLAIALERNGEPRRAVAEYRAFLDRYPEHMLAGRVEDRLTTLALALDDAREPTVVAARSRTNGGWQFHGGISHYYWRNEEQVVHDGNRVVAGSGVLGLADFTASRRGSRFDMLMRFNGAYQHNLVEFDTTGDVGWVSRAFVDFHDTKLGWQARLGRQMRREDGIPQRFDGIGVAYQWRPNLALSLSAGAPVESPRYVTASSRALVAGSVRVSDLFDGRVETSLYAHQQTVDGILDRQAVGGEMSFRSGNFYGVALVDFDVSYAVLNSFLVNGNWRLENGWTLSGRIDVGAMPFLTTRNALSGQSVATIDELLETYSEGQVRTLARDRTAQATTASAGLSIPLGERFDLNVDVALRQSDGTVASGGVAAIPETGGQVFLNASIVGASLLRDNDLLMLTLRSASTRSRDTNTVIVDSRIPFGRGLRINPRIILSQHTANVSNASDQTVLTPAIRLLYRWKRVLIDIEAGARLSSRDIPPLENDPFTPDGVEELQGGFINAGYRLEF